MLFRSDFHETGVASCVDIPEKLAKTFQGSGARKNCAVRGKANRQLEGAFGFARKVKCTDSAWGSSWKEGVSTSTHGGRASLAYLRAHLEESKSIHVVL